MNPVSRIAGAGLAASLLWVVPAWADSEGRVVSIDESEQRFTIALDGGERRTFRTDGTLDLDELEVGEQVTIRHDGEASAESATLAQGIEPAAEMDDGTAAGVDPGERDEIARSDEAEEPEQDRAATTDMDRDRTDVAAAPRTERSTLPSTASPIPLILGSGALLTGAGVWLRRRR